MVFVLAVTQDKELDKRIRDSLGTEGWWVSQVEDRQSALRSAADHEPHLVLVDEDIDGADDLVRAFGSRSGGPGAVILSDDREDGRRRSGVDAVLEKTAGSDQLLASVKKVMSQPHSPISAADLQGGAILSARDIFEDVLREVADEAAARKAGEDTSPGIESSGSVVAAQPVGAQLTGTAVEDLELAEEPVQEAVAETAEEPLAADVVVEPAAVEAAEETVEPAEEPVQEAVAETPEEPPPAETVVEPAAVEAAEETVEPAEEPVQEAVAETPEEPPPAETVVEPAAVEAAEETVEPAEEPVQEAVAETPEEPPPAETVVEPAAVEAAEEIVEPAEEPVQEAVAETPEEPPPAETVVEPAAVEAAEEAVELAEVPDEPQDWETDEATNVEMALLPAAESESEIEDEARCWFESEVEEPPRVPAYPLETIEVPAEILARVGVPGAEFPQPPPVDSRPVWPTEEDMAPDLPPPPEPLGLVEEVEPIEPVELAEAVEPVEPADVAETSESAEPVAEPEQQIPDAFPEPSPPRSMRLPEPTQELELPSAFPLPSLELIETSEGPRPASGPASDTPATERPSELPRVVEAGMGWKRFWLGVAAGLLVFAATSLLLRVAFGGGEPSPGATRSEEQSGPGSAVTTSAAASSELEALVAEELARREAELRQALVEEERRLQQRLDEVDSKNPPNG